MEKTRSEVKFWQKKLFFSTETEIGEDEDELKEVEAENKETESHEFYFLRECEKGQR